MRLCILRRLGRCCCGMLLLMGLGLPVNAGAPRSFAASGPLVNSAAFRGHGRLAFVWYQTLYVLNGETGRLIRLPGAGPASYPAWSSDGRWLAYLDTNAVPDGRLWVVRADGTANQPLKGLPGHVTSFTWSPSADQIAVTVANSAPGAGLWLVRPGGTARLLTRYGSGAVWSPDGRSLAYTAPAPGRNAGDALYTMRLGAGAVRRLSARNDGLIPVGWWPDGKGLIFWRDPFFSNSIAADGMVLYALALGGAPRALTTTLGYADWISWAPRGDRLVAAAGGGREIWHGKALTRCDARSARCTALAAPAGVVALDPAWSPRGDHIAYVRARDAGSVGGFGGAAGNAAWVKTRTLWVADPSGAHARALTQAGGGIYAPEWSRDGRSILYVRDNAVWLIDTARNVSIRIVGKMPEYPAYYGYGYYGRLSWSALLAWYPA